MTSWAPRAGAHYARSAEVQHGDRYKIAEGLVAAVDALWRSFSASAILDDAAQIRRVDCHGSEIRTRGPVARQPAGPVAVQAGQSAAGRAFAAKRAAAIFTRGDAARPGGLG